MTRVLRDIPGLGFGAYKGGGGKTIYAAVLRARIPLLARAEDNLEASSGAGQSVLALAPAAGDAPGRGGAVPAQAVVATAATLTSPSVSNRNATASSSVGNESSAKRAASYEPPSAVRATARTAGTRTAARGPSSGC